MSGNCRPWQEVIPFFAFPPAVRKIIYTTNATESLNRVIRKTTKTRGSFPTDDAATKMDRKRLARSPRAVTLRFNPHQPIQCIQAFCVFVAGLIKKSTNIQDFNMIRCFDLDDALFCQRAERTANGFSSCAQKVRKIGTRNRYLQFQPTR